MNGTPQAGGRPSLFAAAGLLMGGRTIAFAATILTPILLVRLFSTGEFGTYKQLFLVFSTLYAVAQMGMAESLFFFLPHGGARSGHYVANAGILLGVAGFATLAALVMADNAIAHWLGNPSLAAQLPFIGAFSLLMLASAPFEIAMVSDGRYRLAATTYATSDLLKAASLIVPALLFRRLDAVLAGAVAFAALRLAVAGVYFQRTFRGRFRPSATLLADQLRYSVPFALAGVLEVAQANYHQYAVAHYFDAAAFAVYAVGCLQIPLVEFLATSTSNVMMVQLATARQEQRDDQALDIWLNATRKLALVFFPLVAMLFVTGRDLLVLLFTDRYAASVSVFHVSLATIALTAFATDAVLRTYAETRFLMAVGAAKLVIVALVVGPALHTFGLPGAILASVVAIGLAKGLSVLRIKRVLGVSLRRVLPWRSIADIALVSTVAALAGVSARWFVHDAPLLVAMAVSAAVTGGVCAALVLAGRVLSADERAIVSGWLDRATRRTSAALSSDG